MADVPSVMQVTEEDSANTMGPVVVSVFSHNEECFSARSATPYTVTAVLSTT